MFESCLVPGRRNGIDFVARGRNRTRGSARLMPVIADPTRHPGRRLALELLVRAAAIAAATTVILGLLPAIARAVG